MADEDQGGGGSPSIILPLLNTVAIAGCAGLLYYTKLVFQRPPITDSGERKRIAAERKRPAAPPSPAYIQFPHQTINIESLPRRPKPLDGTTQQIEGKLHYITLALSLEIRDSSKQDIIENLRPFILDRILTVLGHKSFQELNSVQGRFLVQSQIIELVNEVVETHVSPRPLDPWVTNVYFTEFVVQ